jgi:sporulation protein YlmC with PRC-barrel domain
MRLSALLNRKVVSESGQQLGRVHDVRGELVGGRLQVTGLVAGELGILERYGIGTHGSGGPGQAKVHGHPVIPWERVVRVGSEVVVRDESPIPSR